MINKREELKQLWRENDIDLNDFRLYTRRFMKNGMMCIAIFLCIFITVTSIASASAHRDSVYLILGVAISVCIISIFKWVGNMFAECLDYDFNQYLTVYESKPKRSLGGIRRVSRFKKRHQHKRWYK